MSRLPDDLQAQRLAELYERLLNVAAQGDTVPAQKVPLTEQLADVAADFREELRTATAVGIEIAHRLRLADGRLLFKNHAAIFSLGFGTGQSIRACQA